MFGTPVTRWAVLAMTAAVVVNGHAADEYVDVQYTRILVPLDEPLTLTPAAWKQLDLGFSRNANEVFADQFNIFKAVKWEVDIARGDTTDFRERTAHSARRAFTKTFEYGAREAAVELPFFLWLQDRQDFVADLLRNSIGNVEEESVSPLGTSYNAAERSWWKRMSRNGELRYGLRPFRTSPYAYFSLGLKDDDTFIILGHLRYYYDHLVDHKFEFAMSMPLPHDVSLDVGTSYQFGRHDDEHRFAIKLIKEIKGGGIAHVGFDLHERPMLLAGITLPW